MIGLMPTDAEVTVIRADRLLGMLQCARLFHRIEHASGGDIAASMPVRAGAIPGFLVTFDLSASDRSELLDAAIAFSSPMDIATAVPDDRRSGDQSAWLRCNGIPELLQWVRTARVWLRRLVLWT